MVNSHHSKKRVVTFSILIIFCVVIAYYFQSIGVEIVYTHLFYIPIVLSCIFWQRRGIIVASFLGISLIITHLIIQPEISIYNDLLRCLIFIMVAIFVSNVSSLEKSKTILLEQETKKVKNSLKEIKEKNKYLTSSRNKLKLKNEELEKWHKILVNRQTRIDELKKKKLKPKRKK